MYCKNCNSLIPDDSIFCPLCGSKQEITEELNTSENKEIIKEIKSKLEYENQNSRNEDDSEIKHQNTYKCKYCGSDVPTNQTVCPICGKKRPISKLVIILGVVLGLILLLSIVTGIEGYNSSDSNSDYEYGYEDYEDYEDEEINEEDDNQEILNDGTYNESLIKDFSYFELENCLKKYDENSQEYKNILGIWVGYKTGLEKQIQSKEELSKAWNSDKNNDFQMHSYINKLATCLGISYDDKYFESVKKSMYDDITNGGTFGDIQKTCRNSTEYISSEKIKQKINEISKAAENCNKIVNEKESRNSELTYQQKQEIENCEYMDIYIASRVKNNDHISIAGIDLNDEYVDSYSCLDEYGNIIICTFINNPSGMGDYSGFFYNTGSGTYTDSQGFEIEYPEYKEIDPALVDNGDDDDDIYYAELELMSLLK